MTGLYDLLLVNSRNYRDKVALIDSDGQEISYGELSSRINALAWSLSRRGIRKGQHVGLMFHNRSELIVTFYAALKIGAVAVPFSFQLLDREIVDGIKASGCDAFLFEEGLVNDVSFVQGDCDEVKVWACLFSCSSMEPKDMVSFASLLAEGDQKWAFRACVGADDDELMLFTSGSTGKPKCVVHSHEGALMLFSLAMMSGSAFRHDDIMLYYAPLYHLAGITYLAYLMSLGATLVLMRGFDPLRFFDLIDSYRVTQVFLIPPVLIDRLVAEDAQRDLASVKWVILSGGIGGPDVARKAFRLFQNASLCTTYGQTERAANTVLYLSREEFAREPCLASSIGKVTQYSEVKLLDGKGNEVDEGEAYARCPGMLKRYEGRAFPFDEGWFATGDVLRRNNQGYYWFVDRTKDMIKTGGENVFPLEVEAVVGQMPGVVECAVFGLPGGRFGETVSVAVVVEREGAVLAEDVTEWCRSRMAGFKRPRAIFFVDELPRNSVGKVQKAQLKERFGGAIS